MNSRLHLVQSAAVFSVLVLAAACQRGGDTAGGEGTGAPTAPPDPRTSGLFAALTLPTNLDAEKVAIGARLYHDTNLSGDGTQSCSSCHNIAEGGDDGLPTSPGINGIPGPINSPTSLNSHLNFVQFWDGRAATLEEQAAGPVANPGEMGAVWDDVVAYVAAEPWYAEKFAAEYPDGVNQTNITHAIAEFERSLVTPARFDAWLQGDDTAMTAAELEGLALFQSTGCTSCHSGAGLGGSSYQRMGLIENYFEDRGNLTEVDNGRFNVTQNEEDRHKFKVPILRNITLTAPTSARPFVPWHVISSAKR
jgi:cytochrome c peroxidase